jgi:hypothetical protein
MRETGQVWARCVLWAGVALSACSSTNNEMSSGAATGGTSTVPVKTIAGSTGTTPTTAAGRGATGSATVADGNAGVSAPIKGASAGTAAESGAGAAAPVVAGALAAGANAAGTGSAGQSGAAGSAGVGGAAAGTGSAGNAGAKAAGASGGSAGEVGNAGGAGNAGAAGNAGSSGAARAPFMATGQPLTATQRSWTWVPFEGTQCRDGSPAGLSVNLNPASKKAVLFFEGGGACFDQSTCSALVSPANIPLTSRTPGDAGLFDRSNSDNPVKDWNFVYIPYCTGDVFLGDNPDGKIDGLTGTQHFVGRNNVKAFLHRLVPTFANAEQIMLSGRSAGGFGAIWNSEFVQWAFGNIPVTIVDDSGPPITTKFVPLCLIELQAKTWKLQRTTLQECGADCMQGADSQAQNLAHLGKVAPPLTIALIESDADAVIRGFYGVGVNNGRNDCKGSLDVLAPGMTASSFQAALRDYRTRVMPFSKFSTFFIENTSQHMWLLDSSMYGLSARSDGVRLVDWLRDVLEGKASHHGLK